MELDVKTEHCGDGYFEENSSEISSDSNENVILGRNDSEQCCDGYFEESIPNSPIELELFSDEDDDKHKFENKNFSSLSKKRNKKNAREKGCKSSDNVKCGDIYWSKVYNSYLYTCSMCHANGFKTLTYHYKKCHALFNKSRKDLSTVNNKKRKNFESIEIEMNDTQKIALEQLKSLPKEFENRKSKIGKTKTSNNKSPLLCIFCGKKFFNMEDLKAHHDEHSGPEPYICTFCGSSFPDYDKKEHHEMQHIELKEKKNVELVK